MLDTLGMILIAVVSGLSLWVLSGMIGLLQLAKKEAAAFGDELPKGLDEVKNAATRWMIVERKVRVEELDSLEGRADLRDRADHWRSLLETLPVAGFLGTVIPVARALMLNADANANSLAKNLSDSLGAALITTAIGLAAFMVGLMVFGAIERRLSEIERKAILSYVRASEEGGA